MKNTIEYHLAWTKNGLPLFRRRNDLWKGSSGFEPLYLNTEFNSKSGRGIVVVADCCRDILRLKALTETTLLRIRYLSIRLSRPFTDCQIIPRVKMIPK